MSEGEIKLLKQKLKEEAQDAAYQQQEMNQISPGAGDLPQGNTPVGLAATPQQQQQEAEEFTQILSLPKKLKKKNGYRVDEQKIWRRILAKMEKS